MDTNFYHDITAKLFDLLFHGHGLQSIMNYAYEVFHNNPVSVTDNSGKILSVSAQTQFSDPTLTEQIKAGFVTDNIFSAFKQDNHFNAMAQSKFAFYSTDENSRFTDLPAIAHGWIFAPVRIHNVNAAIINICGINEQFPEDALKLADLFSEAVSIELQKSNFFLHTHGIAYEALLYDILERRVTDQDVIHQRFHTLGRKISEKYYVVVIQTAPTAQNESILAAVKQATLRTFFPDCMSLIYKNDIVLLIGTSHDLPPTCEALEDFIIFLKGNELIAGMSNPFSNITDMTNSYTEAIRAIQIGTVLDKKSLYAYVDYAIFHVLDTCNRSEKIEAMCVPGLLEIAQRNDAFEMELLYTLFLYVKHMKNASLVSQILHIHKNTLFYRINKITSQFNIDLNNGEDIFKVVLTEKILRYLETLNR